MNQRAQRYREPLSPIEMERFFDSLDKEGKEILAAQMMTLHYLTNELQQLHAGLLERLDKGKEIKPDDFGGLCISLTDKEKGTWSKGIGEIELLCNAFVGTFSSAWEELPAGVFEELIELAKETEEMAEQSQDEESTSPSSSSIINLEKWKVDNQWKN